jgi:hypothetical protein
MTNAGKTPRQRCSAGVALRDLWDWLRGSGYRPERHYMRGGSARKHGASH